MPGITVEANSIGLRLQLGYAFLPLQEIGSILAHEVGELKCAGIGVLVEVK